MALKYGTAFADSHQFVVGTATAETDEVFGGGSVIDYGHSFVTFMTGIARGPVLLQIDARDSQPISFDEDGWEVIEEATIEVAETPVRVFDLTGSMAEEFDDILATLAPGRYRVRACSSGRDANWDIDVEDPSESYLLMLWPASELEPFTQIKKVDLVWNHSGGPDSESVSTLSAPSIPDVWVGDTASPLMQESSSDSVSRLGYTTDSANWGGRPLDGHLLELVEVLSTSTSNLYRLTAVMRLAKLDRDLVDALSMLTLDGRVNVEKWVLRQAYEKAQLVEIKWLSRALEVVENGLPLPHEMQDQGAAFSRVANEVEVSAPTVYSAINPTDNHAYPRWQIAFDLLYFVSFQSDEYSVFQTALTAADVYGRLEVDKYLETLKERITSAGSSGYSD